MATTTPADRPAGRSGTHHPTRFRARVAAVAALTAVGVLTGCQQVQTDDSAANREVEEVSSAPVGDREVRPGGELVMALSAEPDRLDPTTSSSLYTRYVMETVCQKLYDLDEAGEIVPLLATELPTVSEDGLTVTIPVRTDAQFADGTPFDAEAVVTTLQRNLEKEDSSRRSELGPVEAVSAVDEATVQVTYTAPFAPLTAALADRAGMIMSPTALEQAGDDFGDAPVCVGPFKFVERVPQTSITVERDPLYYDADRVSLDSITYRIITDANIRAANLRSGDVQVADSISTQDVDALMGEEPITVLQTGSLGYQALTINVGNADGVGQPPGTVEGPFAEDTRVRRALAMSIDRETLVESVFNGWYDPACSPIAPTTPFATDASNACPEHDPEAAVALLEEAGVTTPVPMEMQISNNPDSLRLAQALQAQVAEGGFELEIVPVEYSTLLDVQSRGDFQTEQLGWSGRIDPHGNMATFLTTGAGSNYSGYSSPEVDDLLSRAAQPTDEAERAELYGQAVTLLQQDNPLIYLYRQRNITGLRGQEVAGISTYADGVVRLSYATFLA